MDLRAPMGWVERHAGKLAVAGVTAAELVVMDERQDALVHFVAIPRRDFVLVLEWRVHPEARKLEGPRLKQVLAGLSFPE